MIGSNAIVACDKILVTSSASCILFALHTCWNTIVHLHINRPTLFLTLFCAEVDDLEVGYCYLEENRHFRIPFVAHEGRARGQVFFQLQQAKMDSHNRRGCIEGTSRLHRRVQRLLKSPVSTFCSPMQKLVWWLRCNDVPWCFLYVCV